MTKPRTRHVWVRPPGIPVEHQGFVMDWRKDEGGQWSALVMYANRQEQMVTEWMTVDRLRPVESSPEIGSAYG